MVLILMGNSGAGCGAVQYFGEVVGDSPLEQAASSIERILAGPSVLHSAFAPAGHQPIKEFMGEHYGFAGQNGVVYMHEGYSIGAARIWRGVGNSSDAAGKVQLRISSEPMSHGTLRASSWVSSIHGATAGDLEDLCSCSQVPLYLQLLSPGQGGRAARPAPWLSASRERDAEETTKPVSRRTLVSAPQPAQEGGSLGDCKGALWMLGRGEALEALEVDAAPSDRMLERIQRARYRCDAACLRVSRRCAEREDMDL